MENIKKIEDMSLNAWPSHKMELYDGWILRFSYFYTHRTNSVEQFGNSMLPWREKSPTAKTSTSVSALRLSLKSVLLYHRILITHWKIVATKSNIRRRS